MFLGFKAGSKGQYSLTLGWGKEGGCKAVSASRKVAQFLGDDCVNVCCSIAKSCVWPPNISSGVTASSQLPAKIHKLYTSFIWEGHF